jgi:hypothetical protein
MRPKKEFSIKNRSLSAPVFKNGVHSAGVRLSSHVPGGCKSRYLHLPAPSTRATSDPFHKGWAPSEYPRS